MHVCSEAYVIGALVLAHSLKETGTDKKVAVMITRDLSQSSQDALNQVFDSVHQVDAIESQSLANLSMLGRPELLSTYTKLHVWQLVEYRRVVFLDADTLAIQALDSLFDEREYPLTAHQVAAAPDIGWPDCFNSGVFVCVPSRDTYAALVEFSVTDGSFDGGDQGLLNDFFSGTKWVRLPFVYNVSPSAVYSYAPAYRRYKDQIKLVHFLGAVKPWQCERNDQGVPDGRGYSPETHHLLVKWWQTHDKHYSRSLASDHGRVNAAYRGHLPPFQSGS